MDSRQRAVNDFRGRVSPRLAARGSTGFGRQRRPDRMEALRRLQAAAASDGIEQNEDQVQRGLAVACGLLDAHAEALMRLGIPIAQIYADAASKSAGKAIECITAAKEQACWAGSDGTDYRQSMLSDWL